MKRAFLFVVILAAIVLASIYFLNRSLNRHEVRWAVEKPVLIGFSTGTTRAERWVRDRNRFVEKVQELGSDVILASSDYDISKEISQIENLISQGIDVLVVLPSDSEKIAPAIEKANQAGIKIIAYDRLIRNSNIDMYISYDNIRAGELEAESILAAVDHGRFAYIGGSQTDNNSFLLRSGTMNILSPKIENGDINLVIDQYIEDGKPENAYLVVKDYLAAGGRLDAVIVANDGIASGVIQALAESGLAGKIPVSGQDAELSAIRRIVAGTQISTVYKPIRPLAYKAAEVAVSIANGVPVDTTDLVDNGQMMVSAYFFEPIVVTKDNIADTIIKDGFYSYDDIYNSAAQ